LPHRADLLLTSSSVVDLARQSVMDNERHVIAEGSYGDGLSWLIWAQRQSPGDAQPGADELMGMIRVTTAGGRVLHEGGAGGPALFPGGSDGRQYRRQ